VESPARDSSWGVSFSLREPLIGCWSLAGSKLDVSRAWLRDSAQPQVALGLRLATNEEGFG
jgi:hypothetical protein